MSDTGFTLFFFAFAVAMAGVGFGFGILFERTRWSNLITEGRLVRSSIARKGLIGERGGI